MTPEQELESRWMALPYLFLSPAKLREVIEYESNKAIEMVIAAGLSRYRQ